MTSAPSVYFPENSPDLDVIYQDETVSKFYEWPLAVTQTRRALNPSGLSSADTSVYYTYSGLEWQYITMARQKDGRYRNITLRSVSGDSFLFYITTKLDLDSEVHYSGPVTVSGAYYTLSKHSSVDDAELNAVEFIPLMNSGIFNLPTTEQARMITLAHRSVTGDPYRLTQFLPRTSIEVDDLSAEIIDVVTLRVSDSIVVSPTIADKSITGAKILDGTVSGVLITPGTITSNEIAAGTITGNKIAANTISGALITAGTITADNISTRTITADKIVLSGITANLLGPEAVTAAALASGAVISGKLAANSVLASNLTAGSVTAYAIAANTITADKLDVTNLSSVSANTGSLVVTDTITVASGTINAGLVTMNQTGLSIGDVNTELTETNALRIYGKVNPSGGNVVGMALYNNLNPVTPHAIFQTDYDNALEIENLAPDGVTNINIPQGPYESAFNVWVADPAYPQFSVGYDYTDVRNELYLSNNLTLASGVTTLNGTTDLNGTTTVSGPLFVKSTDGFMTHAYIQPDAALLNVPTTVNGGLTVQNGDTATRGNFSVTNSSNTFKYAEVTASAATFNVPIVFNNNPLMYAARSSNQIFPAHTQTIATWNVIYANNNLTTVGSPVSSFTVPVGGYYLINLEFWFNNSPVVIAAIGGGYGGTESYGGNTSAGQVFQRTKIQYLIANQNFYFYLQPNITTTSTAIYNRPMLVIKRVH